MRHPKAQSTRHRRVSRCLSESLEPRLFLSANADYVTYLYHDLLHRAPDAAGLAYFESKLDQGASAASIVNQIRTGPEYLTPQITDLYHRFLNRDPSTADLKYWINKTASLGSSYQVSLIGIALSDEEIAKDPYGRNFSTQLVELELGRAPTPTEAQGSPENWQIRLWESEKLGNVINSPEAQQYQIQTYYQAYLGRSGDAQGTAYWQHILTSSPVSIPDESGPVTLPAPGATAPADVQLGFLTSPEFIAGPAPIVATLDTGVSLSLADASNALSFDLLNALAPTNPDLVLSGYSAQAALLMAYQGAAGQTAAQMQQALHLPDGPLATEFAQLAAAIQTSANGDLQIANSLWVQQGYSLLTSYTDAVQQMASAGLRQVDYINQTEAARQAINAWVSDQTHGMIPELFPAGSLTPDIRLTLVNALYLDAKWSEPFSADDTHPAAFATESAAGSAAPVTVQMMSQDNDFKYLDIADFQAVEMPYANSNLSMLVFLPKADATNPLAPLTAMEQELTSQNLTTWTSQMQTSYLDLEIPQFKITSTLALNDPLINLGMPDAFDTDKADFSGITGNKDLSISTVSQQAVIEVGEQGTQAAAATGITMRTACIVYNPLTPIPVHADHPFLFAIRDNTTGTLLFTGQVANPAASG